ncbi:MAG: hypothetical protein HLX50_16705 [Alteromonadaceae bacterium]|nr:hypothetical protein [Alteromonadaceae bacterium]
MDFYTNSFSIVFAFAVTALFRYFIMPRLDLIPTEDSGFFYQVAMVVLILLIFLGSLLGGRYVIEIILG